MQRLYKFNGFVEKWMALVTPCSLLPGVLLSVWLSSLAFLVPWIFAFMTFSGGLGSGFRDLKKAVLHPAPIIVCLFILHLWMPVLAWGAGKVFFYDDPYTITGIILAFIIPTGIVSFMWVSLNKGNIALTLSIILLDTLLAPFLIPLSLRFMVGASVHIDTLGMMKGLILMVVLPSLAGMALNQLTKGRVKTTLAPKLAPFSKLGLMVVVAINASIVAPFFTNLNGKVVAVALTVLVLAASGYVWGWIAARRMKGDQGMAVAMTFNSGMRNISAGAVIAAAYFPAPVMLPVMIGTLFQQVLASICAHFLQASYSRRGTVAVPQQQPVGQPLQQPLLPGARTSALR